MMAETGQLWAVLKKRRPEDSLHLIASRLLSGDITSGNAARTVKISVTTG
jgi:hypothetical protein